MSPLFRLPLRHGRAEGSPGQLSAKYEQQANTNKSAKLEYCFICEFPFFVAGSKLGENVPEIGKHG
jgi:hypothetical protein